MKPPVILVVEDNPITRKMMRFTLESEGYGVLEAEDGRSALTLTEERQPDLVVQDYVLPDMDGLSLVAGIRTVPGGSTLPVLIVTGMVSLLDDLRSRAEGPTTVLAKPIEPSRLIEAVKTHLARAAPANPGQGRRILVVDDEGPGRKLAALRLRDAGFEPETAASGAEALVRAETSPPDAVLSDVLMPGMDGFELCRAVRHHRRLRDVPVVLLSSAFVEEPDRRLALEMGANALLSRTPDMREAIAILCQALNDGARPAPAASSPATAALHAERVQIQLEKQVARNAALLRQSAIQAAALSVVRGLAMGLATPRDVASVLGDVLVHCLDAAGLSTGLLYLVAPDGQLRLQAQAGVPATQRDAGARCFGHPEVLERVLEAGEPVAVLFASGDDRALPEIGAALGQASGLFIPFVVGSERIGVLLLASESHDLSDPVWVGFGRALATQFGQTIAVGRHVARGIASEVRYRSLMEQANDAILLLDGSVIVEVNRQAEVLLQRPRLSILGRRYDEFVAPEERSGPSLSPAEALAEETQRVRVRTLLRPDGSLVPVELSGSVVHMGNESLGLLILRDVTERHLMERKLRDSERQYRLLFEDNPQPMWVYDPQTLAFLAVNEAAVGLYGYPPEEFLRMTVAEIHPPEDVPAIARQGDGPPLRPFRHRRQDGSWLDVEIASRAISMGGAAARLVLVTDVSEKRKLEAQLMQAQKMEAVGRLAGGVAHDFNNLLGVITGYAELLRKDVGAVGPAEKRIREILAAADRAAGLTRQLLAFSRKGVIAPAVLDLNAVVTEIERMLRRLIGEDVELVLTLGNDLGAIYADRGQVDQVIMNLVVNARDAMPQGGRLTIETANVVLGGADARGREGLAAGRYVLLAVSDTGHGMDAVTQSRIFDPFFTTKEEGKGTGLGLATVFGIVKRGGGEVAVESTPGVGTTFRILLPRVAGRPEPARTAAARTPPPGGSETVLVVEDAQALRMMIHEILAGAGYRVLEAADPETALAAAAAHRGLVHLLLTDVVMPQMSGPELVARVHASALESAVLYMSGYTDDAIGSRGILEPGTHFLQKPFTAEDLLRKVREAIDAPRRPG